MLQHSSLTALWPSHAGLLDRTQRIRLHQTLVTVALIIGIALVLCLYLYQISRVTVANYDYLNSQASYQRLQRENANLLAEYAIEQSLAKMDERARAAGYGPVETPRYVRIAPAGAPASASVTIQRATPVSAAAARLRVRPLSSSDAP